MFSEIHQLKQIGLKKAQVARKLEIDVKTVSKYWEASPDDFAAIYGKMARKKSHAPLFLVFGEEISTLAISSI